MSDINIGAITEALNDKTDRNLRNVDTLSKADAVIDYQMPTAANNYTWYRKYKSGWVEQGGVQIGNAVYGKVTVNLPVQMADNTYQAFGNIGWVGESVWYTDTGTAAGKALVTDVCGATTDKTTTSFSIQSFSTHNWYVCGKAAV